MFVSVCLLSLQGCKTFEGNYAERKEKRKLAREWVKNGAPKDTVYVVGEYVAPEKPGYVPDEMPYQPSYDKITDLIHTKLSVSFDWKKQYLFGRAELTLSPYFYAQDSVILDAKGFDIHEVSIYLNESWQKVDFDYSDSLHLVVFLDRLYSKDEKYKLFIDYTAKPNELDLSTEYSAISDDKGLYFINPLGEDTTKPRQIWTQGETEASSCWFPTLDQPNEKTTQEIRITVDTNFLTISNGLLVAQLYNDDGTRTDYWEQDKPHAPYLFMMAIGEFAVIHDSWIAPEANQKIEVNYYVEQDYAQHGMKIFGNTPEMLGFFSKRLGYEYPWDKYSQIVVRDYVSGAMENTTASIFMEAVQVTDRELLDKHWDGIIAHELFHHWFGDLVTCESWGQLALNESFANYSEYLWFEYKYGRDYADHHREEEESGYLRQSKSEQYPIVRYNYAHRMQMFDAHSYNKGGLVLHMLRKEVGQEAFFQSLKHYLHKNQFTDSEIHELRLSFEEVTGRDLNWFFDQWFLNAGHPKLQVEKSYDNDSLKIIVTQLQDSLYTPTYRISTDIEISVNGEKQIFPIVLDGKKSVFNFSLSGTPEYVLFDSEQQIFGEIDGGMEINDALNLIDHERYQVRKNAYDLLISTLAETNYLILYDPTITDSSDVTIEQLTSIKDQCLFGIVEGLDDPSEHIRKYVLTGLKGVQEEESLALIEKYQKLTVNDPNSLVRAAALENLSLLYPNMDEEDESLSKQLFIGALEDSSYTVLASGLYAAVANELQEAEQYIEDYRNSSRVAILDVIAKFYVHQGDSTQGEWLKQSFMKIKGADKMKVIANFSELVKISSSPDKKQLIEYFGTLGVESLDLYERYTCYRILYALFGIEEANKARRNVVSNEKSTLLQSVYAGWEASLK